MNGWFASVWKGAPGTTNDAVRFHVGSLRRKLEPNPATPRYILTEPWIGYRFIADQSCHDEKTLVHAETRRRGEEKGETLCGLRLLTCSPGRGSSPRLRVSA